MHDNPIKCRMGKLDLMGRYPFHLHNLGDGGASSYATNCSAHTNFQRCFVLHCTNAATLRGNTCFNTTGFSYMLVIFMALNLRALFSITQNHAAPCAAIQNFP